MKKTIILCLALLPLSLWAQDTQWEVDEEQPAVKEQAKETVKEQADPNAKYLRGAVPMVDGQIVFSTTITAPGKTRRQIYDILYSYLDRMTRAKNQISSKIISADSEKGTINGYYEEWLVFSSSLFSLDRTRFFFGIEVTCSDGRAEVVMRRLRYVYGEDGRNAEKLTAEEWISDDAAVNKKNTRLYPRSGKFRRKTIDRKDYLFNKLQEEVKTKG